MKDWLEIEARFRRLAEPLQQMRLDFQWGAAGEYWRLAGVSGSPITKEFEAIATIAGRHLESVLPKQGEVFERINGESSKPHKWYRAVKELTKDFEFGFYGTQTDEDGNSKGNIYTGSIPHPVLSSANLCLYLHENYPIEHVSPIVFLGESTAEVMPSQSASNSPSTTNWKNWGDHPLIVIFVVIVGIVTIWGVLKSEPPIVAPVTLSTQNIPGNSGQQVNIGNVNGGIVNITPPRATQPQSASTQTSAVPPTRTVNINSTQEKSSCPTTESVELALKQARSLSSYGKQDEAYTALVGDALCSGNLDQAYSIAKKISSYGGQDREYARILAMAISMGKLEFAGEIAGKFSSYGAQDSARKQVLDALRKRS